MNAIETKEEILDHVYNVKKQLDDLERDLYKNDYKLETLFKLEKNLWNYRTYLNRCLEIINNSKEGK